MKRAKMLAIAGIAFAAALLLLWTEAPQPIAAAATTGNSITDIYDAIGTTKTGAIQDWGFAALIRYNGKTILFDTGMDPGILEHNAKALGADLKKVDFVVISHWHNDHTGGFPYFLKVNSRAKIYLPEEEVGEESGRFFTWAGMYIDGAADPAAALPLEERFYQGRKPALDIKPAGMFAGRANVQGVVKTTEIMPGVFLIHTTSQLMGSFSAYPPHSPEKPQMDGLPELSLALRTKNGMVLITGCSHSTVTGIVAAMKKTTGEDVDLVEGGFHLIGYTAEQITAVANALKNDLGVRRVAPAHCTGETAMAIFRQVYGEKYVHAGLESVVEF